MPEFLYDGNGKAVGYLRESVIFELAGSPIGQVKEGCVFRTNGEFVGQLMHGMVVAMRGRAPSNIGRMTTAPRSLPPLAAPPARMAPKHVEVDVFARLKGR